MKKAVFNKKGTKQVVNTGFKLFDKQTNCITKGNALLNTQFSSFVRPFCECECNGFPFKEGHLMNFDLEPFRKWRIPSHIEKMITNRERKDSIILYMFFTTDKEFGIEPFLWVMTTQNHELIYRSTVCGYGKQYMKRFDASCEIIKYITD